MKLFGLFFGVLILLFFGCKKEDGIQINNKTIYNCNSEFVNGDELTDSLGTFTFSSAKLRTSECAKSGKYCIKIDSVEKYGFSIELHNIKEGETIHASVWQKKGEPDGTLICATNKGDYTRTYANNMPVKNGWLNHTIDITTIKPIDTLSIYVFAGGKTAYFDDFKVVRQRFIPEFDYDKQLVIYIPDSSKTKLNQYIENAINAKIITKENKQYVNAFIIKQQDSIPIQMRLKGDWTDHLKLGKPSYRIKIKGNGAFMGLKTFSIQHPQTRNYMHEWFTHQLFDKEDLLSTKYDFLQVKINGINRGVYAIEEHFDKQLLEQRNRREGPILKMDESGFWETVLIPDTIKNSGISLPYFEASFISLFKKKRTLKNKVLKQQLIEGSKLVELYKNQYQHPEQIFDLDALAKFYVIHEISNGYHGLGWHNRRFYFNPVTEKLEQIGFDMLPGTNPKTTLIILNNIRSINIRNEKSIKKYLILNQAFKGYFMSYLKQYSDSTYLANLFKDLDSKIDKRERLIKNEYPNFYFDKNFYFERATYIQSKLQFIETQWDSLLALNESDFIKEQSNYKPNQSNLYLENISVNFYIHKRDSAKYELEMENFHLNDVEIIGFKTKKQKDTINYFEESIKMKAFSNNHKADYFSLILDKKPNKVVFKITNNSDSIYVKKVIKWKKPVGVTSRIKLEQKFNPNSKYYTIKDSILTFKQGKYQINELIYIPKNYKVVIPKSTTIDFVNGGGLIVNNSFYCEGDSLSPINFLSTDGNNNGITVLKAPLVKMRYVTTDSLNTLHYKKWNLTGGITIYESEVEMSNCTISSNTCEDALNIIRSHFNINYLTITNTFSDGFDADFCTGKITNSIFKNTGNDCIDFSGSTVEINDIIIYKSGDKGISGGERSNLKINNIFIDGAITGIAAKDDTKITGNNINVKNTEYGVAAFQKKAEYDKAYIELTNVTYSNLIKKGLVDKGSVVKINGNFFVGTLVLDIDQLYARFEK